MYIVPNKCEDGWLFLCQHSHIYRQFLTSVVIARSCEALVLFGFPGTLFLRNDKTFEDMCALLCAQ